MKVVGLCVSFLMALVWFPNDFRFWVMVKLLHVGHDEFLWNFSTTFSMNYETLSKLILGLRKLLACINEFIFVELWY